MKGDKATIHNQTTGDITVRESYRNEPEVPTASNIEAAPDSHAPLITSPSSVRCELPTFKSLRVCSPHTHLLAPPEAFLATNCPI